MFGVKKRHDELVELLEENQKAIDNLTIELKETKKVLTALDLQRILDIMSTFISSTDYLTELIENASFEVVDDKDCCPGIKGE